MSVVAVIQARTGSSRLPGKALKSLGGRSVIAHVLERTVLIPGADMVVIAIPDLERDKPLATIAGGYGVHSWSGSEWDVLDRIRGAAFWTGADTIMRITADCPFIDPEVAGEVLRYFRSGDYDYAWNDTSRSGFPDGLDVEVFTSSALVAASARATMRSDREHVTPWMRRTLKCAPAYTYAGGDYSHLKLSIDRPEDLEYAIQIHRHLRHGEFSIANTLRAVQKVEAE